MIIQQYSCTAICAENLGRMKRDGEKGKHLVLDCIPVELSELLHIVNPVNLCLTYNNHHTSSTTKQSLSTMSIFALLEHSTSFFYLGTIVLLTCLPALTYLSTRISCSVAQAAVEGDDKALPQAPYYLPIIGNAIDMLFGTERFLLKLQLVTYSESGLVCYLKDLLSTLN